MTAHVDPAATAIVAAVMGGAPSPEPEGLYEFDEDFQTKITALVLRDSSFAQSTAGLIDPRYFSDNAEAALVYIATGYYAVYKKAPSLSIWGQLLADAIRAKRIRIDLLPEIRMKIAEVVKTDVSDREFVATQISEFARNQAMEAALFRVASELLPKRDFLTIEKILKEAQAVGIGEDTGTYSYYAEVKGRTEIRKAIAAGTYLHDGITTGVPELDKVLYHRGWGRKELSVLMAPPKGGKSMGLAEFAKNASIAGYAVLYATLEVSAAITADRMDANFTDTMMKNLTVTPFEVQAKIEEIEKKAGPLEIKEYATGSMKASMLRRLIEAFRAKGVVFDLVVVDYADIMAPEHRSDVGRENSTSIYIDLRGIAFDYDCAVLTATQTNRDGIKATVSTMGDVAEDINKIRIADIVISINAMEAEKAAGEARLYFAAVRNGEDGFTLNIQQDRSKMKFIKKVTGRS